MKNLKPAVPIIAIFYLISDLYYSLLMPLISENSYLRYTIKSLFEGNLGSINVYFFRTLFTLVIIVVTIIGLFRYFTSEEKKINRLLEFGLIYHSVNTLLYLPITIYTLLGKNISSSGPGWFYYIQAPLFIIAAIIVCIYFSRQIKTFQNPPFGDREKSYGATPYEQYLDSGKITVSSMLRFKNYLLDIFFIYIMAFSAVIQSLSTFYNFNYLSLDNSLGFSLVFYLAFLIYYIFMEAVFGKTLGKIITNSGVQFYGKSSFVGALGRTFCRLIPFERFSYLGNNGYGWHDKFSKTTVEKIGTHFDSEEDLSDLTEHLIEG